MHHVTSTYRYNSDSLSETSLRYSANISAIDFDGST